MDQVIFENRRVLDLGSNLGELSRSARERGAELVDGYEFDSYFVEVANLINAYNGVTRVSFYEKDITSPATYTNRYDITLAFSVFVYIEPLLHLVCGMTNEVLVLETHRLEDNLESHYVESVRRFLPSYRVLGETEWGSIGSADERRAVIAFARSELALERALSAASSSLTVGEWRSTVERVAS
jgi:hypothetical protein